MEWTKTSWPCIYRVVVQRKSNRLSSRNRNLNLLSQSLSRSPDDGIDSCWQACSPECIHSFGCRHRRAMTASISSQHAMEDRVPRHVLRPLPPTPWMDSFSWGFSSFSAHSSIHLLDILKPMAATYRAIRTLPCYQHHPVSLGKRHCSASTTMVRPISTEGSVDARDFLVFSVWWNDVWKLFAYACVSLLFAVRAILCECCRKGKRKSEEKENEKKLFIIE